MYGVSLYRMSFIQGYPYIGDPLNGYDLRARQKGHGRNQTGHGRFSEFGFGILRCTISDDGLSTTEAGCATLRIKVLDQVVACEGGPNRSAIEDYVRSMMLKL